MISFYEDQREVEAGYGKYILMLLMLFLSFMMFSRFKYPSFKAISWKTEHSLPKFLIIVLLLGLTLVYYQWMFALLFLSYLLYGFFRPFISLAWRKEIEEDEDEEDETPPLNKFE
jgi:CDP-diacylglycerol--serine O-phosphatidyltransferase